MGNPPVMRNTLEFRHESWITDEVFDLCSTYNVSLCMADWPAFMTGHAAGVDFTGMFIDLAGGGHPEPQLEPKPGVRSKLWFVHWLWFSFQLLPGRRWLGRIGEAFRSLRIRGFVPDIHRPDDRAPSLITALFVPYFMFVINTLKGARGGYMYGCNYDRRLGELVKPGQGD